jgi:hypothetical protein
MLLELKCLSANAYDMFAPQSQQSQHTTLFRGSFNACYCELVPVTPLTNHILYIHRVYYCMYTLYYREYHCLDCTATVPGTLGTSCSSSTSLQSPHCSASKLCCLILANCSQDSGQVLLSASLQWSTGLYQLL